MRRKARRRPKEATVAAAAGLSIVLQSLMLCAGRFAVLHSVLDGRKKATAQVQYGKKKKKKKKKKSDESSQEQEEQLALQTQKIEKWLSNELHLNMSDIKPAIEAHMTEKCNMRRRAEKKFKIDSRNLVIYTAFLVIFSISASSTDNTSILNVRNTVTPAITNFSSVNYAGELII